MNQPLSRLPGHVYAPGAAPHEPSRVEQGLGTVVRVANDLGELAMPLLIAVSGVILVWVIIETIRQRRRRRRLAAYLVPRPAPLPAEPPIQPRRPTRQLGAHPVSRPTTPAHRRQA